MNLPFIDKNVTINQLVSIFKEIADNHAQINSFGYGQEYDAAATTITNFPLFWAFAQPSKISNQSMKFVFKFIVCDLVNAEGISRQQTEVHSDTINTLWDICFLLRDYYDLAITFDINAIPFTEKWDNRVTGWAIDINIEVPQEYGFCDAPFKSCVSGSTNFAGPLPSSGCGAGACFSFTNTPTISFTGDGSTCNPVEANVNISTQPGNSLTIFPDGLYASGGTGGGGADIIITDSSTIIFSGSGTTESPLTASVKVSNNVGNIIFAFGDGLYSSGATIARDCSDYASCYYPLSSNPLGYLTVTSGDTRYYPLNSNPSAYLVKVFTNNTNSISFSGSGTTAQPLIANVNISSTAGNILVSFSDGLYVSGVTQILYTSKNGLVLSGSTFLFGQPVGQSGNPANIVFDTEVPLNNHKIFFSGTGGVYVGDSALNTSGSTSGLFLSAPKITAAGQKPTIAFNITDGPDTISGQPWGVSSIVWRSLNNNMPTLAAANFGANSGAAISYHYATTHSNGSAYTSAIEMWLGYNDGTSGVILGMYGKGDHFAGTRANPSVEIPFCLNIGQSWSNYSGFANTNGSLNIDANNRAINIWNLSGNTASISDKVLAYKSDGTVVVDPFVHSTKSIFGNDLANPGVYLLNIPQVSLRGISTQNTQLELSNAGSATANIENAIFFSVDNAPLFLASSYPSNKAVYAFKSSTTVTGTSIQHYLASANALGTGGLTGMNVINYNSEAVSGYLPTVQIPFRLALGATFIGTVTTLAVNARSNPIYITSLPAKASDNTITQILNVDATTGAVTQTKFIALSGTTTEAPILLLANPLLASLVNGSVEYDGSHLYFTISSTRYQIDQQTSALTGITVHVSGNTLIIDDARADGVKKGAATFTASDFNDDGAGLISIDYVNGQKATSGTTGFLTSVDWNTFNNKQSALTFTGLTGVLVSGSTNITIGVQNARADGATRGIAMFTAADFNDNGLGLISIDYTNGQQATSGTTGFLTAADWIRFNGAVISGVTYIFSTGLTNTSNTITANLATGISGGQSVIGGTGSGDNLTIKSTTNATKGLINFGTAATSFFDEVNSYIKITTSGLGATLNAVSGTFLTNGTAATSGVTQVSPALTQEGFGWSSTNAISRSVKFSSYVFTVQGAANPTGAWILQSSVNGGAFGTPMYFNTAGQFALGTTSPLYGLQFFDGSGLGIGHDCNTTNTAFGSGLIMRRSRANAAISSAGYYLSQLLTQGAFGAVSSTGSNTTNYRTSAEIRVESSQVYTASVGGSIMRFFNTASGSTTATEILTLGDRSCVGVGGVASPLALLSIAAGTTNVAQINLPVSSAPTNPNDGDIWRQDNTNTGLKIRINGVTKTVTVS